MTGYEVVIVGGGMVGSALGCALGDLGFRVAVVEAREPLATWPADTVDARTSALTRASENILRNLGVWDRMVAMRVSAYREMHVWDAEGFGEIHFDSAEIGEPDLGHIVENRVIQKALWERLGEIATVERICPANVVALDLDGERPVVVLDLGRASRTRGSAVRSAHPTDSAASRIAASRACRRAAVGRPAHAIAEHRAGDADLAGD